MSCHILFWKIGFPTNSNCGKADFKFFNLKTIETKNGSMMETLQNRDQVTWNANRNRTPFLEQSPQQYRRNFEWLLK